MPKLPTTLGERIVPRANRGIASIRPGIAAAGALDAAEMTGRAVQNLAGGMGRAGDILFEREQRIEQENDDARIREADVEIANRFRSILHDPQKGYLTVKGKFAVDGHQGVSKDAQLAISQVGAGLQNERQRNAFKAAANARLENLLDVAGSHASREFTAYQDSTRNARIESLTADGVASYSNPQLLSFYRESLSFQVGEKWKAAGASPETIKNEIRASLLSFDESVKKRRVDDTYDQALAQIQVDPESMIRRLRGTAVPPEMDLATPDLIAAVIQRESGGKADAVSPKGAVGMMQLMPDTARRMAKKLGMPFNETRLKFDADYNKALGTAYLNEQLERYGGNVALALAAYNAGPGKVDEWINKNGDPRAGDISNEEWIAKIPFAETRAYVPAVLGGASKDPELAELGIERELVLFGKAEARQRELQADARAVLDPRISAEVAALQRGELVTSPVTDAELAKAYGPDGVSIRRQEIVQARKFGLVSAQITMRPMDQAVQIVEGMKPTDTNDPLFVDKLRDYDLARTILENMRADRLKDPAAYVLTNSPDLRALWQAADTDPSLVSSAMSRTIELQRQIGTPERDIRPLPDSVAKSWLETIGKAENADKQLEALKAFLPADDEMARRAIDQLASLPGGAVYSVAAGVSLDDDGLAHDILAGQAQMALLKGSQGLGGDKVRTELDAMLGNVLAFNPQARAAIIDATTALYAKAAVEAGDAGADEVSTDRLESALARLTGGVVEFRGQHVIPPQAGMDDADIEDLLDRLTDKDLSRAMFSTGETVLAENVQDDGAFQSVGDGSYLLLVDGRPVIDTETLKPFVIDLKPLLGRVAPKRPQAGTFAPPGVIVTPSMMTARTMAVPSPQGLVVPGNIDIYTRPKVRNADGSISTVRSMSYQNEAGQEVLIPTVSNEGKIMSDDEAKRYWAEKGQYLGVFDSPQAADAYADVLHKQQERYYNGVR